MKTRNTLPMRYVAVLLIVSVLGAVPILFNFVVDPFNMNRLFDLDLDKEEISVKAHYPLFKMIEYPRKKSTHIILGDSRSRALRDKYFEESGFTGAYNFAYGAATIPEIYSTFEYLRDNADVKTLIVGVPLRAFGVDHRGNMNRVPEAIRLADAPLRYYASWFVAKTGWANVDDRYGQTIDQFARLMPRLVSAAKADDRSDWTLDDLLDPNVCVENCPLPEVLDGPGHAKLVRPFKLGLGLGPWTTVWQQQEIDRTLPKQFARQVEKNAANDWRGFRFSEDLWAKIEEIAAWCDREGIQLLFFVPPTIVEMQHRIAEFGVADVNQAYRGRLAKLAPVIDLDFDNALTRDLQNFKDAYHFNSKVARAIVAELVQQVVPSDRRDTRSWGANNLVRCPLGDETAVSAQIYDGLTMREGVNCRIWTSTEADPYALELTLDSLVPSGADSCRIGSKSDA